MARFSNGWIKVYRSLGEGDLVQNPFLLALWVRLLTWAHWKPSKIMWEGHQRDLPAGAVVFGFRELAQHWDCSTSTIHKWSHYLHKTERITLETGTRGSLAIIRNWELYQSQDDDEQTPSEHGANTERTRAEHGANLIEEDKKGRRKKEVYLPPLAEIWNQNRGSLPQVLGCSKTRLSSAKARWEEKPDPEYWATIVRKLAASSFCQGGGKDGWRATFDFLLQPDTQHKALEGKYDERAPRANGKHVPAEVQAELAELEKMRKDAVEGRL